MMNPAAVLGFVIVLSFTVLQQNCQLTDNGEVSTINHAFEFTVIATKYEKNTATTNLQKTTNGFNTSTVLNEYTNHTNVDRFNNTEKSDEHTDFPSTLQYSVNTKISSAKYIKDYNLTTIKVSDNNFTKPPFMVREIEISTDSANLQIQAVLSRADKETDRININNLILKDPCGQFGKCEFTSTLKFKYCQCDEKCYIYNDCCSNQILLNVSNTHQIECRPFSNLPNYMYKGAFMISNCPTSFTDQYIKVHCLNEDFVEVGPIVFGNNSLVYKNKFCAICNDVRSYQFFQIQLFNIEASDIDSLSNKTQKEKMLILLKKKTIRYKFFASNQNINLRHCLMVKSPKNETTECRQYTSNPVATIDSSTGDAFFYRNIYCVPPETTVKICAGPAIDAFVGDNSYDQNYGLHPLSVMFGFDVDDTQSDTCIDQLVGYCGNQELYINYTFSLSLVLNFDNPTAVQYLKQIWLSLAWSFSITNDIKLVSFRAYPCNSSCPIDVVVRIFSGRKLQELLTFRKNVNNFKWNEKIMEQTSGNITNAHAYVSPETVQVGPVMLELKENSMNIENLLRDGKMSVSANGTVEFCNDISLFLIVGKNESNIFLIQSFHCAALLVVSQINIYNVRTIATYICISLSEIALIISIVICRKLGITKSVAGSNTENLSVSLALANLLFLLGVGANDNKIVCYVIGVVLHYLWLTVFVFMSVAVGYIGHNLRTLAVNRMGSLVIKRQKMRLTIVGLVIPLMIVGPSVALDFLKIRNFRVNYGGEICFPLSYPANLYFVSGPILLCIVINLVQLIMIIAYIVRTKQQLVNLRRSRSFQQAHVYLRLTIITGAFWVTGITGGLLQSEILNDIFIVLCSLQGFFIAMCCLSTRSTYTFICNSLGRSYSQSDEAEIKPSIN